MGTSAHGASIDTEAIAPRMMHRCIDRAARIHTAAGAPAALEELST